MIDGDTLVADITVGLGVCLMDQHCRLHGINTPEIHDADPVKRKAAIAAQSRLGVLVLSKREVIMEVADLDKYGRRLVVIYLDPATNAESVNAQLIREGFGVAYDGGKR